MLIWMQWLMGFNLSYRYSIPYISFFYIFLLIIFLWYFGYFNTLFYWIISLSYHWVYLLILYTFFFFINFWWFLLSRNYCLITTRYCFDSRLPFFSPSFPFWPLLISRLTISCFLLLSSLPFYSSSSFSPTLSFLSFLCLWNFNSIIYHTLTVWKILKILFTKWKWSFP